MTLITACIDKGPLLSMVPRAMQHIIITHRQPAGVTRKTPRERLLSMGRMGELKKHLNTRLLWFQDIQVLLTCCLLLIYHCYRQEEPKLN